MELSTNQEYKALFERIKIQVQQSQIKAMLSVNKEMLLLYWNIGKEILQRQEKEGWGTKVIAQLARDLKRNFPNMGGFSERNLKYMRAFAKVYPDFEIVQPPVAQLTWSHNLILIDKIKDEKIRFWYAEQAIINGWSRDMLVIHIERKLHQVQGALPTNFQKNLPAADSDLVQQAFKDPYIFDFLHLTDDAKEREIEDAMMKHITTFLLELGQGFSFVGRQYPIEVSNKEYKIDLLFYHLKLRCFVVIDLKARAFMPEDAGKINFYVNAVDEYLRHENDNPTIGIVLCKAKDNVLAEFALKGISTPVGVAEFRLTEALPDDIQSSFPTIEALEEELRNINVDIDPKKD